jgi:hypothetical protein
MKLFASFIIPTQCERARQGQIVMVKPQPCRNCERVHVEQLNWQISSLACDALILLAPQDE